jgi:hypothetical protein
MLNDLMFLLYCMDSSTIFMKSPVIGSRNWLTKTYLVYNLCDSGEGYSNSGRPSVSLSVRLSHFLVYTITWVNMDGF